MKPFARIVLSALQVAIALSISGCWDVRDINDRTPALALGMDYSQRRGWTVSLADALLPSSGSGLYTGTVHVAHGADLTDAIDTLRSQLSRRLYIGSVKVYVFGGGLLQAGRLRYALHALSLHNEVNPTSYAMAADGAAQALLSQPDGELNVMAVRLLSEFEKEESLRGGHVVMPLWEAYRRTMAPGSALYLPVFTVLPKSGARSSETVVMNSDGRPVLRLDRQDTIALKWLLGTPDRSVLKLYGGTEVKMTSAQVKTQFIAKDTRTLQIILHAQAEVYSVPSANIDSPTVSELNHETAIRIVEHTMRLVNELKTAGVDVCEWQETARRAGLTGFDMHTVQVVLVSSVHTVPHLAPAL